MQSFEKLPLPQGELYFLNCFLSEARSDALYQEVKNTAQWQQESIKLFGKIVKQPRLTCWYGKGMSAASRYRQALPAEDWPPLLSEVRTEIEDLTGASFNSVLVNYYRNGSDGMGMHADDEPILGPKPIIASLSLGENRPIDFHHKTDKSKKLRVHQPNGSLLLMAGDIQSYWKHGVAKSKKILGPRLNFTFRWLKAIQS